MCLDAKTNYETVKSRNAVTAYKIMEKINGEYYPVFGTGINHEVRKNVRTPSRGWVGFHAFTNVEVARRLHDTFMEPAGWNRKLTLDTDRIVLVKVKMYGKVRYGFMESLTFGIFNHGIEASRMIITGEVRPSKKIVDKAIA